MIAYVNRSAQIFFRVLNNFRFRVKNAQRIRQGNIQNEIEKPHFFIFKCVKLVNYPPYQTLFFAVSQRRISSLYFSGKRLRK